MIEDGIVRDGLIPPGVIIKIPQNHTTDLEVTLEGALMITAAPAQITHFLYNGTLCEVAGNDVIWLEPTPDQL